MTEGITTKTRTTEKLHIIDLDFLYQQYIDNQKVLRQRYASISMHQYTESGCELSFYVESLPLKITIEEKVVEIVKINGEVEAYLIKNSSKLRLNFWKIYSNSAVKTLAIANPDSKSDCHDEYIMTIDSNSGTQQSSFVIKIIPHTHSSPNSFNLILNLPRLKNKNTQPRPNQLSLELPVNPINIIQHQAQYHNSLIRATNYKITEAVRQVTLFENRMSIGDDEIGHLHNLIFQIIDQAKFKLFSFDKINKRILQGNLCENIDYKHELYIPKTNLVEMNEHNIKNPLLIEVLALVDSIYSEAIINELNEMFITDLCLSFSYFRLDKSPKDQGTIIEEINIIKKQLAKLYFMVINAEFVEFKTELNRLFQPQS